MEKFSHLSLVLFYLLSSFIILSHFLLRWAIAHRMNEIRDRIHQALKSARAMRSFHKSIGQLSSLLTEKEKLNTEELMEVGREQMAEFSDEINKELSSIQHAIAALEYKRAHEHRILWPKWAQRKFQGLQEEVQELENITREIPQY